jgi:hypothetical protein
MSLRERLKTASDEHPDEGLLDVMMRVLGSDCYTMHPPSLLEPGCRLPDREAMWCTVLCVDGPVVGLVRDVDQKTLQLVLSGDLTPIGSTRADREHVPLSWIQTMIARGMDLGPKVRPSTWLVRRMVAELEPLGLKLPATLPAVVSNLRRNPHLPIAERFATIKMLSRQSLQRYCAGTGPASTPSTPTRLEAPPGSVDLSRVLDSRASPEPLGPRKLPRTVWPSSHRRASRKRRRDDADAQEDAETAELLVRLKRQPSWCHETGLDPDTHEQLGRLFSRARENPRYRPAVRGFLETLRDLGFK